MTLTWTDYPDGSAALLVPAGETAQLRALYEHLLKPIFEAENPQVMQGILAGFRGDLAEAAEATAARADALLAEVAAARQQVSDALAETRKRDQLFDALSALRSLVKEGDVPRYSVTPGAALNSVIEEIVDPALRRAEQSYLPKTAKADG